MSLVELWSLQGQFFILLGIGVLLRKFGIFTKESKTMLTDFVLYAALPCSIILSFRMEIDASVVTSLVTVFLVSVATQAFCFGLSKLVFRKQDPTRRNVLRYGILVSNAGFLGLPIAGELFGPVGYMLASIYLIPQRIVMWSAGLSTFSNEASNKKQMFLKVALHPCMIAVYIGLLLMATQLPLPKFVLSTMKSVGACTTPLSMMLIGTIFAEMDRKSFSIDFQLILFSFYRLGLIPLAAYIGCRMLGIDPLVTGPAVILAAMPGGSTTAILASKYGSDSTYASKLVIVSTILSMISIPFWGMVL